MTLTGDGAPQDPSELACAVLGCGEAGARWVVVGEHWRLACCAPHADDVDGDPGSWRLAAGRPGILRIAKAGDGDPPDRHEAEAALRDRP